MFTRDQRPVPREESPPVFHHTSRLEAFSDGVFAIAITLLILEIRVPEAGGGGGAQLWAALLARWLSYFAFVLGFGTIFVAWVGHHLLLQNLRAVT
ncbi:TMEM175 family protein [Deinococcus apachensis]|uniref:TMEM175 family protein n=1 Tax=Deinococcus apachensis TaxID=309886 RepID=UPI000A03B6EC|nr:TMEM175 family protein [Deinococcus apachensis]